MMKFVKLIFKEGLTHVRTLVGGTLECEIGVRSNLGLELKLGCGNPDSIRKVLVE